MNNEVDLKLVKIPDFNSNSFSTVFFKHSWVKSDELDLPKFNKKLEYLYQKDLERDSGARKMEYIIIHNVLKKESYLMKISLFNELNLDIKKILFKQHDFYIPRSIWFLAFAMLNEKNIPFLSDWCNRNNS